MSLTDFVIAGMLEPQYLGDSVYVGHDKFHIILCTNNNDGRGCVNMIYLDPSVFNALVEYEEKINNFKPEKEE